MSVPLDEIKQLRAIEATLEIRTHDNSSCLRIIARGESAMFCVRMPATVWREFCRRQLALPPPLPKGDRP